VQQKLILKSRKGLEQLATGKASSRALCEVQQKLLGDLPSLPAYENGFPQLEVGGEDRQSAFLGLRDILRYGMQNWHLSTYGCICCFEEDETLIFAAVSFF
jgi:hypothetical protein